MGMLEAGYRMSYNKKAETVLEGPDAVAAVKAELRDKFDFTFVSPAGSNVLPCRLKDTEDDGSKQLAQLLPDAVVEQIVGEDMLFPTIERKRIAVAWALTS